MSINYKPGDIIKERYEIIRKFDDGNQGKTFLAKDRDKGGSYCVVKYLDAKSETAYKRFQNEAKILEESKHERIPKFLDHFDFLQGQYLVQQYIEGPNLRQILKKYGKLSEFEVTCLLEQVLDVLNYIHSLEIIHRDIKPDNLVWRSKLGKIDVVLIDFGIIKEIGQNLTREGEFTGTPGYASPEQWARETVTIRSDIYSLARTAIEALTGKSPASDITISETIWPPQGEFTPGLQNILNRMEKSNPEERYQSPQEVLDDINHLKSSIYTLLEHTRSYKVLENLECPIFGYDYLAEYIGDSSGSRFIIKQLKPISIDRFTIEDIKQELQNKRELLNRIVSNKKRRLECFYDETTKNLFFCVELIESKRDRLKQLSEMCLSEAYLITDTIKDIPKIQKRSIPPSFTFNLKLQLQYFLLFVKQWRIVPALLIIALISIVAQHKYVEGLYYQGLELQKNKQFEKAKDTYDIAINFPFFPSFLNRYKPQILVAKSSTLGQLPPPTRTLEQLDLCNEAVKIEPKFTGALNCRGEIRKDLGKYQDAITDFNQVIDLELKNSPNTELMLAYFNKGEALERWVKLGEIGKALNAAEKLVKLDQAREAFETAAKEADKIITNQNLPNEERNKAINIRDQSQSKLQRK
ncbi:hypothetical protein BCD67_13410 [Oscillatoriales cyanobacterium USR001]|nr:hypothetical protein BCD67_13410 [Oscillatoriales cyanobacterium USR001]